MEQVAAAQWDHIVVGAGSAGCAVAARLAQRPGARVLLLEAGGRTDGLKIRIPAGVMKIMRNPQYDWLYQTEPDSSQHARAMTWSAGKGLGGSSSINGMVFIRGLIADFARWGEHGASGWAYDDVLPYFRKLESWKGEAHPERGMEGPIGVSQTRVHPLAHDVLAAAQMCGFPVRADINARMREGFGLTQANIARGLRQSASCGYLALPGLGKSLTVETKARVEHLLFEGMRCVGVRVAREGRTWDIRAGGEVVVSTGAIATPALLMRSGLGPAEVLRAAGIEVLHDSPAIGANLQEHGAIAVGLSSRVPTLNIEGRGWRAVRSGLEWLVTRTGPVAMSVVQVSGFVRSRAGLDAPDVQIQFVPLGYDDSGEQPRMASAPQVGFTINPCRPKSRGQITISAPGAQSAPRIDHQLFGHEDDIAVLARGGEIVRRLVGTQRLAGKLSGELYPGAMAADAQGWEAYARMAGFIQSHPCGTCAMGGETAPLDTHLRVRGVRRLRVADASVMPTILSTNTNATTMMIGERVADFIAKEAHA